MALYDKWDVKNGLPYVLQFFSLISDSLGSVLGNKTKIQILTIMQVIWIIQTSF